MCATCRLFHEPCVSVLGHRELFYISERSVQKSSANENQTGIHWSKIESNLKFRPPKFFRKNLSYKRIYFLRNNTFEIHHLSKIMYMCRNIIVFWLVCPYLHAINGKHSCILFSWLICINIKMLQKRKAKQDVNKKKQLWCLQYLLTESAYYDECAWFKTGTTKHITR